MTTIDLRREVARVLMDRWPEFASAHPRLAAVIDQQLLVEQAAHRLAADPAYQRAMARALAAGYALDQLRAVVAEHAMRYVKTLL
jgi:hypothetical protein